MNSEEGSYQLSQVEDYFLGTSITYCAKNRMKKRCFYSSDEDFRWKSKRQGMKKNSVVIDEFNHETHWCVGL